MIKTINGSGRYMMVNGGFPATTYINTSSGFMSVGDLRFNTNTQNLEVFDGQVWRELNSSHASVGLTPEAEKALDWAIKKAQEELILIEKAKDNPAIADLLEQKKKIEDQITMVDNLTKKYD